MLGEINTNSEKQTPVFPVVAGFGSLILSLGGAALALDLIKPLSALLISATGISCFPLFLGITIAAVFAVFLLGTVIFCLVSSSNSDAIDEKTQKTSKPKNWDSIEFIPVLGSGSGIEEVEEGKLYSARLKRDNEPTLYMNFERIDGSNEQYWRKYHTYASRAQQFFEYFFTPSEVNAVCDDQILLADEELETLNEKKARITELYQAFQETDEIRSRDASEMQKYMKYATALCGGMTGYSMGFGSYTSGKGALFLVYATTEQIHQRHTDVDFPEDWKASQDRTSFEHIVMTYTFLTTDNSSNTTHFGIFRNPYKSFGLSEEHKGISMALHAFGAEIGASLDKKWMVTQPINSMEQIFRDSLPEEAIVSLKDLEDPALIDFIASGSIGPKIAVENGALAQKFF